MDNKHRQLPLADENEQALREKIKRALDKNALTQVWLINRLRERGLTTDKTELSSVFSGTRRGAKISALLRVSDEILTHYEKVMNNG